jgi:hypothetical protein
MRAALSSISDEIRPVGSGSVVGIEPEHPPLTLSTAL